MCFPLRPSHLRLTAPVRIIPKTFLQTTVFRYTFLIAYRKPPKISNRTMNSKCRTPHPLTQTLPSYYVIRCYWKQAEKRCTVLISRVQVPPGNLRRLERSAKSPEERRPTEHWPAAQKPRGGRRAGRSVLCSLDGWNALLRRPAPGPGGWTERGE